jgi:hypothetical protein
MNEFKGDCVYKHIGGTAFYGNVTGAFIEDGVRKTKLWNIKFDHDKEEGVTLSQLMRYQKKYGKQKHQYDTEVNKKLPETTMVPTLPTSKKKVSTVEMKKKAPPKKKKTPVKKKPSIEKQQKELKERLPPSKLLDADDNTVTTNNNYTSDEPYPYRVQYKNGSTPSYEPIKLNNHFLPQFKLPYDSIPLVDLMCKLSLPSQTNQCYCTSINKICKKLDASSNNDSCRQEEPR